MTALATLTNLASQLDALITVEQAPALLGWVQSGGLESLQAGLLELPLATTPVVAQNKPADVIGILVSLADRLQHPTEALRVWLRSNGLQSLRPSLEHYLAVYPKLSCEERIYAPYTRGKKLGNGNMGEVFELCLPGSKCDRVLKVGMVKTDSMKLAHQLEAKYGKTAGELGIGPIVYRSGICDDIGYIITQRLSGPALAEKYPVTPADITTAMDLYYTLLVKTHISQYDPKPANYMFDGDRLYLIDYGIAKIPVDSVTKKNIAEWTWKQYYIHMNEIGTVLLNSIAGAAEYWGTPQNWINDEKTSRTKVLVGLSDAIDAWFNGKFPGTKTHIRTYGYEEDDIDPSVPGADKLLYR